MIPLIKRRFVNFNVQTEKKSINQHTLSSGVIEK